MDGGEGGELCAEGSGEQCALPCERGWIARGTSQGFPGRHRTATNQNFSGFVTGNRDYLKFVLSFHYAVYRRESVPKHDCFTRSGCAAALSPHPAVAGDSRALE